MVTPDWSVTCDGQSDTTLKLKVYDLNNNGRVIMDDVQFTRDEYACLEDNDILKSYISYSKREGYMDGYDVCFNNRNIKYSKSKDIRDLPFTVFDNCYKTGDYKTGDTDTNKNYPMVMPGPVPQEDFEICHGNSWQFSIKVMDPKQ